MYVLAFATFTLFGHWGFFCAGLPPLFVLLLLLLCYILFLKGLLHCMIPVLLYQPPSPEMKLIAKMGLQKSRFFWYGLLTSPVFQIGTWSLTEAGAGSSALLQKVTTCRSVAEVLKTMLIFLVSGSSWCHYVIQSIMPHMSHKWHIISQVANNHVSQVAGF